MAERLAGEGYAVLVPDLFYRNAPYGPFDAKTAFAVEKTKARADGAGRRHDTGDDHPRQRRPSSMRSPPKASPGRSASSAIAWAARGR